MMVWTVMTEMTVVSEMLQVVVTGKGALPGAAPHRLGWDVS